MKNILNKILGIGAVGIASAIIATTPYSANAQNSNFESADLGSQITITQSPSGDRDAKNIVKLMRAHNSNYETLTDNVEVVLDKNGLVGRCYSRTGQESSYSFINDEKGTLLAVVETPYTTSSKEKQIAAEKTAGEYCKEHKSVSQFYDMIFTFNDKGEYTVDASPCGWEKPNKEVLKEIASILSNKYNREKN